MVDIFERIARNVAIVAIVRDLNKRGVPAPASATWHRNTIRKIALNVAYLGQRDHKGDVYEGGRGKGWSGRSCSTRPARCWATRSARRANRAG